MARMSPRTRSHRHLVVMVIWSALTLILTRHEQAGGSEPTNQTTTTTTTTTTANGKFANKDELLETAASLDADDMHAATGYKIIASGWPVTSALWPTARIENAQSDNDTDAGQFTRVEPFIYVDKPRPIDYSLLLDLNETLVERITSSIKPPLGVQLSFEYYFDHDHKVTALPGIKIEVNRKQIKYLEPGNTTTASSDKAKMWIKFAGLIYLDDKLQLANHDWLKISLVNRQSSSLVALRRLEVTFLTSAPEVEPAAPSVPAANKNVAPPVPGLKTEVPPQREFSPEQDQPQQGEPFSPDESQEPGLQKIAETAARPYESDAGRPPLPSSTTAQKYQPAFYPHSITGQSPELGTGPQPPRTTTHEHANRPNQQEFSPEQRRPLSPDESEELGPEDIAEPGPEPYVPDAGRRPLPSSATVHEHVHQPANHQASDNYASSAAKQVSVPHIDPQLSGTTAHGHGSSKHPATKPDRTKKGSDKKEHRNEVDSGTGATSNALTSTIKPVAPKPKSWMSIIAGRKRRKRQVVPVEALGAQNGSQITLTCHQSSFCQHWRADGPDQIQWSLARMPPSTNAVQNGYYYVSNRNNYGNWSEILRLYLNETESATNSDQESDHCIELALYVTERSRLNIYRLVRAPTSAGDEPAPLGHAYGNDEHARLLLTWAPTTTTSSNGSATGTGPAGRRALPGSRLPARDHGGWTLETLCYGDFFADFKHCSSGGCAFGFQMDVSPRPFGHLPTSGGGADEAPDMALANDKHQHQPLVVLGADEEEQVVGVALLSDYATNNRRSPAPPDMPNKWLAAWQRDEVKPDHDWRFYPKLDVLVGDSSVDLVNLNDEAYYQMHSTWLTMQTYLNFNASLAIELVRMDTGGNDSANLSATNDEQVFSLLVSTRLVDRNFVNIWNTSHVIKWPAQARYYDLGAANLTDKIEPARHEQLAKDDKARLYKIIIELELDCRHSSWVSGGQQEFKLTIANVSLADRCFPNPCQSGSCQQTGTHPEEGWQCHCDATHRGRRCEFGRWCELAHVLPPPANNHQTPTASVGSQQKRQELLVKAPPANGAKISGNKYCELKLAGPKELGQNKTKCTELDVTLNENLYTEDGKTFHCSCQDDYYLNDEAKCKPAHKCSSLVCDAIGQICDETKPFDKTQPCQCNEKQDWHPKPDNPGKCIRRQCQDKMRDCGFNAHICLPTLPGERPICKCAPGFQLKTNDKGQKYCQSSACILPTLNDCQQICQVRSGLENNLNLDRPYNCSCHPGYVLDKDGRSCAPVGPSATKTTSDNQLATCDPACNRDTQICTAHGCKCKQGFVADREEWTNITQSIRSPSKSPIRYVKKVQCLNVCSLTYAENIDEFEKVRSVCPLGLCDPDTFQCRCSDPNSKALIHTKYEPVAANDTSKPSARLSPMCRLRRVCEPGSANYVFCRARGAICVPDYEKSAMFSCECPPATEKQHMNQTEFVCKPRCSSIELNCQLKWATCRLFERDRVKCDCLPGFLPDKDKGTCYLANYTYSFSLILKNKYYQPEARYHRPGSRPEAPDGPTEHDGQQEPPASDEPHDLVPELEAPHFQRSDAQEQEANGGGASDRHHSKLARQDRQPMFIAEFNQCNISQVLPKSIIEDPYEHDIESYLNYIDQCNENIHKQTKSLQINSRLAEDLRQSLRQHLTEFAVTTNESLCMELEPDGTYLNCTIYLQSNEPISVSTINNAFTNCDKYGADPDSCWIKPRLLLKRAPFNNEVATGMDSQSARAGQTTLGTNNSDNYFNFIQVIPCEINNFCGDDAYSFHLGDTTSRCSCKCHEELGRYDVKNLAPARHQRNGHEPGAQAPMVAADATLSNDQKELDRWNSLHLTDPTKDICRPRNQCDSNATYCQHKTGSVCQYDARSGSRCRCSYYENNEGYCIKHPLEIQYEVVIGVIVLLAGSLLVSLIVNILSLIRSKRTGAFGHNKQYPLSEFPARNNNSNPPVRNLSRSTGVPNFAFDND